jgi:hypothetical protein
MLVAIISTFLLLSANKPLAAYFPFPIFRQRTVTDDQPDGSCPTNPPLSTTERTVFGIWGCVVYGYPSTGGVLRKDADLVDMLFLSLPRSHASQRSPSAEEEDRFCNLLRRSAATVWCDVVAE